MEKGLVFDLCGTLIENNYNNSPFRKIAEILSYKGDVEDFKERFENTFMKSYFSSLDEGFKMVCKVFNVNHEEVKESLSNFWNQKNRTYELFPESLNVLNYLKEKGHQLALLSNLDCYSYKSIEEKLSIEDYFDMALFSFKAGMLKTEEKMWEPIFKKFKCNTEDLVLIGDTLRCDGKAADRLGIDFILVDRETNIDYHGKKISNLYELMNIF